MHNAIPFQSSNVISKTRYLLVSNISLVNITHLILSSISEMIENNWYGVPFDMHIRS